MSKIKHEQMYTIILHGDIEILTRGFYLVEKEGNTLIADSRASVTLKVETKSIKSIDNVDMPPSLR